MIIIPTGPAVMGVELEVLPCHAVMAQHDSRPCVAATAPMCRYGDAAYMAIAWCPILTRNRRTHRAVSRPVASGKGVLLTIPEVWTEVQVLLRLKSINVFPGAFIDATPDELVDALKHPMLEVREQAMLDLAEKESFTTAEAAKQASRREKREQQKRGE